MSRRFSVGGEARYVYLGALGYGCADEDGVRCLEPSQGNVFSFVPVAELELPGSRIRAGGRLLPYLVAGAGVHGIRSYGQETTATGTVRDWVGGITLGAGFNAGGSPGFGLEADWDMLFDGNAGGRHGIATQFASILAGFRFR